MNLFKRTKRIWQLSQKDYQRIDILTDAQLEEIPDEEQKAVFFGEGTHEEFEENERERKGFKGIFGL